MKDIKVPEQIMPLIEKACINNSMVDNKELCDLVKSLIYSKPQPNELVVEIGSYQCKSSEVICETIKILDIKSRYITIDIENRGGRIKVEDKYGFAIFMLSDSKYVLPCIKEPISMIYIDGDHSYEGAKSDIELSINKVKSGGVIFIDDYSLVAYPGVYKACEELKKDIRVKELYTRNNLYIVFQKI